MKWVVLAIIVFIPLYTYLTLHFRRRDPVYEPYEEARDRATVDRLLAAGYRRVDLTAMRPTERLRPAMPARVADASGGLPAGLKTALVAAPLLPATVSQVAAASETGAAQPYFIDFTAGLPDETEELMDAQAYVRKGELVIVPNFERVSGALLVRSTETAVRLTVPAGVLAPGRYRVALVARRDTRTWELTVTR